MKDTTLYHYRTRMLIAAHKEYLKICEEIGMKPQSLREWVSSYDIMNRKVDYAYYYQEDDLPMDQIEKHLTDTA